MAQIYKEDMNLMAYPNTFPDTAKGDYTFKVKTQSRSLTLEDIAAKVAQRIGKYTARELEMITEEMMDGICDAVSSGYIVKTPLCLIQPAASGIVYKNELATQVDPDKVSVYANYSQGPAMRAAMGNVLTRSFIQPAVTGPFIADFVSTAFRTDEPTTRAPLTPGKMAVITGHGIKLVDAGNVVGSPQKVGITLTSVATPSKKVFIAPADVSPNEPTRLQFVLPAEATDGDWNVEVTTQYASGGTTTKNLRTFKLPNVVTIGDTGGEVIDPTE